ncbi:MAG TPA: hypothetical protein VEZ90_16750 [Blastocatellia bacterium]|nr:hypothetical protein [Blastocatellia bacterium]
MNKSIRVVSLLSVFAILLLAVATGAGKAGGLSLSNSSATERGGVVATQQEDKLHTPAPGSPERKAIMDALRAELAANGADSNVVFKVYVLKVHNGWAWTDVTPLDPSTNKAVAEGGAQLLHKEDGVWKPKDLSVIPEDPDDPMPEQDLKPKFIRAVVKAFPGCPADIFVKSK